MLLELQKIIDAECVRMPIASMSILDCDDLIAAASAGGLVAAALAVGRIAAEVFAMVGNRGAAIFPGQSFVGLTFKSASAPLFDGGELENVLH